MGTRQLCAGEQSTTVVDYELSSDCLCGEVVHTAGAVGDVSADDEFAAGEVLEDVCHETRVVQQAFGELQVHDEGLSQQEPPFLPSVFLVSSILQMDLWISKL